MNKARFRFVVLGGGWYGCHIADQLGQKGHDVTLLESQDKLFSGASGSNPARLHQGFHYPRSKVTRDHCQQHLSKFMQTYGWATRSIATNVYAVAKDESLVDFGNYVQSMDGLDFDVLHEDEWASFGLRNIEGAVLVNERHILINEVINYFSLQTTFHKEFLADTKQITGDWDGIIDCTFCAHDSRGIERYEPCVTGLVRGPQTDIAVTIMDGPFPSLYPWDEKQKLCSLTSAKWTPLSKTTRTYPEAKAILEEITKEEIADRVQSMKQDLLQYWDGADPYRIIGWGLAIRAMPKSGADSRLVDLVEVEPGRIRIRAGKIDAVVYAQQLVEEYFAL